MPRTKKPAGTAADPRNGRRVELATSEAVRTPDIDLSSFLPTTRGLWQAYWADVAASTQTPADLMWALVWIESVDDYWRKKAAADLEPIVEGSMGQSVANPLYAVANASLQAAERAAKQMGVGAKNRADLGVTLLQERVTLDSINARFAEQEAAGDDADDDPR
jgi:hypothetical protein